MKRFWDIILGGVLIIYIISINYISSTRIAFSYPTVILGIFLVLYHFMKNKIKQSLLLVKRLKLAKMLFGVLVIILIGIEALIINYPKYSENTADYILVLGAGLTNGKTPNLILQGRLEAAIRCLEKNNNEYIVVSGGQGTDEDLPESHAMSIYLQERGIGRDKIIIEDKSRNTNENFKFSKEKILEHSGKSLNDVNIKVITTDFHAFRSSILAKKNGYANFDNYSSETVWYLIPVTYVREAFAVVKSVIFDK